MFIGEMGCWLVILLSDLYSRLRSTNAPLFKYTPVNGHDTHNEDASDDEAEPLRHSISSLEAPPISKPLHPNATERAELRGWRILLLALPACCDITGTTLMNVGLLFVAASIYQMTRGALVLFVGLFSVIFLRRRLSLSQWSALFIVVLGVAIVGLAGAIQPNPQAKPPPDALPSGGEHENLFHITRRMLGWSPTEEKANKDLNIQMAAPSAVLITILGVLAIALAQIFTASQFVLEEWILEHYSLPPIKVVAWEGTFGLLVTLILMALLHLLIGATPSGKNGYFDARAGLHQVLFIPSIAITSLLIMISIGGFNYFGLSITRSVSATARSVIDTCRTLFIWVVSLGLGWETFKWLQILGFAGLVYGTFLFNGIVKAPWAEGGCCGRRLCGCGKRRKGDGAKKDDDAERLLPEDPVEHR